ncbi:type I restriction-modification system specificity subunit [Lacticaseibacillus paracasei subsp. paracasei 8700:2]|uniref:Type I restriction-modification system specificity subunit n=2 Tax=Lacticaseibacillus paracasei TaxID=1597 RepID=A0A826HXV6_LACPA|nr:type I restriction-modification system specificity subunit [Lacticaseibacillus paracasei subsp. paracasei 8700:2]
MWGCGGVWLLMFLEFAWNAWEKRKLGEVVERVTRKNRDLVSTRPLTISAQDGLVDQRKFFSKTVASKNISNYFLLKAGDFAYNKSYSVGYPWGAVKRLDKYPSGVLSTLYIVFKPKKINSQFLVTYFEGTTWYVSVSKVASEGARNHGLLNISASDFFDQQLFFPTKKTEQESIGLTIKVLDDLIAATQDKIDAFEQIKKAFLQHLFDQSWRFGEYSELWTSHLLGEITSKVTEKNTENLYHETFTNSAKYGIVEQQSFFDKLISNEANLTNYYVVRENDFVYNPRISNLAPVGPVRRNKLNRTGVMSPLYYVFKATNAAYPMFLEYFFKGESWYRFMYLNGDTGARSDRFAIKDKVFEQMPVKLPEESEQKKIGALLQNLETVMNQTQERLQKIRTIKDSLLKSLFV